MHRTAFTLLELLVVTSLLVVAASVLVLRFHGVTDAARLRSAAAQATAILDLTAQDAALSGLPRLIDYADSAGAIVIYQPAFRDGAWRWADVARYELSTGVRVDRVIVDAARPQNAEEPAAAIRIRGDGLFGPHGLLLTLHGRWAVVILDAAGGHDVCWPDHPPTAALLTDLRSEMEGV